MGYDADQKVYTFHEFGSSGEVIDAKGTVNGDTWNWTADSKMGEDKYAVRVTIKRVSPTEYTFKLEMSKNGGEFSVVEELTGRKATAPALPQSPSFLIPSRPVARRRLILSGRLQWRGCSSSSSLEVPGG
jgi:hypothetical protein